MNEKDIVRKFLQRDILLEPEALSKLASMDSESLEHLAEDLQARGVQIAGLGDLDTSPPEEAEEGVTSVPGVEVLTEPQGPGSESRVDYLRHFQNRFDRLAAIVRRRYPDREFHSILEVRSRDAQDLMTTAMVFDKSTTSSGSPAMVVEDGTGRMRVLASRNSDAAKQARALVLDEVVGLEGRWDGGKKVFVASRVVFPDIDEQTGTLAQERLHAVFISDLHFGSPDFMEEAFTRFLSWLRGEHGSEEERRMASLTKYLIIGGDLIGEGSEGVLEKYSGLAAILKGVPGDVRIFAIPGEMDTAGILEPQIGFLPGAAKAFSGLGNLQHGGNPSLIRLGPVPVLLYHGRSFEDWVPGSDPGQACEIMKQMLVRRHLAPRYGSSVPLSPTSKDPFLIGDVPRIFHMGHSHGACTATYKGVLLLATPSWRSSDAEKGAGSAYVVDLSSLTVRQMDFSS